MKRAITNERNTHAGRLASLEGRVCELERGAILDGADLRREDLERASPEGARGDAFTRWPDGFEPEEHGVGVRR